MEEPPVFETPEGASGVSPERAAPKTSLFGDILKLVFGTGMGQVILAISALFLTRLYTPEALGLFGIYSSIVSILSVIACLRYEYSIPLPATHAEGANQLAVSLLFAVGVSLLLAPLVWVGGGALAGSLNAPGLRPFLWFLPANILLAGTVAALNYWNTRTFHFERLSMMQVVNMLVTALMQIGLGLLPDAGQRELIIGSLAGTFTATFILVALVIKEDHRLLRSSVRWGGMKTGLIRYKKFPIYNIWSALLNSLSWQLPTFLLTHFFSPAVSAYYTLGNRVLRVPMSLVGGSIAQAQYPRMAKARADGTFPRLIEETFKRLSAYSVLPMLVLAFVGRELFVVLFGPTWAEAGVYTQILSLWTLFWFISSPLTQVFIVLERQEQWLRNQVLVFLSRLAALWIGGLLGDARLTILLFAASGALVYGYLSLRVMQLADVPVWRALRILWGHFRLFLPVGLALGGMQLFAAPGWAQLVFAALVVLGYYVYVIKTDPQLMGFIRRRIPFFSRQEGSK